jgi:hypothetical protein
MSESVELFCNENWIIISKLVDRTTLFFYTFMKYTRGQTIGKLTNPKSFRELVSQIGGSLV